MVILIANRPINRHRLIGFLPINRYRPISQNSMIGRTLIFNAHPELAPSRKLQNLQYGNLDVLKKCLK